MFKTTLTYDAFSKTNYQFTNQRLQRTRKTIKKKINAQGTQNQSQRISQTIWKKQTRFINQYIHIKTPHSYNFI